MRHQPAAVGDLVLLVVRAGVNRWVSLERPVLRDRGTAVYSKAHHGALDTAHHGDGRDLGGRDVGVELRCTCAVRVLEDAERIAGDEKEGVGGEAGVDRGDGCEVEARRRLLTTF